MLLRCVVAAVVVYVVGWFGVISAIVGCVVGCGGDVVAVVRCMYANVAVGIDAICCFVGIFVVVSVLCWFRCKCGYWCC